MKKLLLIAAAFLFGMTACQKEEQVEAEGTGSFTIKIPQTEETRAITGEGTSVNRCILEIYRGETLNKRLETDVINGEASFNNLRLVSSQEYDFVFWADCATGTAAGGFTDLHYSTDSGLKAIGDRGADYVGNSDERDAFYAVKSFIVNNSFSETVTLTRPFGLLIVKTDDLDVVKAQDPALEPNGYTVSYTQMYNTFDASTGTVSGTKAVTYTSDELAGADGTILTDLIWATEAEATLSDFKVTFLRDGQEVTSNDNFKNIPIRRNYKTIVSGNLLTKQGNISIMIDKNFAEGELGGKLDKVSDIDAANQAFLDGATNVTISTAPSTAAEIKLPKTSSPVSITFEVALSQNITISYADGASTGEYPATLYITAPSSTATLTINTANTTVTIPSGTFADVTATTASTTLNIGEDATVTKLTVKAGSVEVYGKVTSFTPANANVTLHISTVEKMKEFAATSSSTIFKKIVLDADIDFKGADFKLGTLITGITLDGQGHKIANFKNTNVKKAGLIDEARGCTIRNLVIENAAITATDDGNGNAYAGTIFGRSYGNMVLENITVTGSTVEGVNKVGGLAGFVAENQITATNCHVTESTIKTTYLEGESGQCGGLVGYLNHPYDSESTCTFTNCTVTNTVINAYMEASHRTNSKFIGCLHGNKATNILVIDNCSVSNVTLNALDELGKAHVSVYGDLLGGQRYGNGTVKITNSPLVYSVYTPAQLVKIQQMANEGNNKGATYFKNATVQLCDDIDLTGISWEPMNVHSASKFVFDGQNHTIKNMTIQKDERFGNGFIFSIVGGTIKNLTMDNAHVSSRGYVDDNTGYFSGNVYGIVAGYAYGTVSFENITVKNSKIMGFGKVGGILGMAADKGGITSFTNCSVENTTIAGCYNIGGLAGLSQNLLTIKNCSIADNVTPVYSPAEAENYVELNTTLTKDGNIVTVRGTFWKYVSDGVDYYYPAYGDYYTDLYYDDCYTAEGLLIAYGICHNK